MKQAKLKSVFTLILVFIISSFIINAVSTTLTSPQDNFVDDDGYLDLRASCTPTTFDGATSYNVTNVTLYSDVSGTWKANKTFQIITPTANSTYFANFTNYINKSAEGTFKWNVLCIDTNETRPFNFTQAFSGNNTIKIKFTKPTI